MLYYAAYNLLFASEVPLPELISSTSNRCDVSIRRVPLDALKSTAHSDDPICNVDQDIISLSWPQVATFRIRKGIEILVDALTGMDERIVRLPLLGTVMATLLHQRGLFVLHASAVEIEGTVAVFLGEKGQGKSTFAAALCARGHRLVSDDIVALHIDGNNVFVLPGYTHIKLWPTSIIALGGDPEQLPEIGPGFEKRLYPVEKPCTMLPLGHVFVLRNGPTLMLQQLSKQDAMLALIAHTYVARFGAQLLQNESAVQHFQQCQVLLRHGDMHRLQYPHNLESIASLAIAVEKYLDCILM